MRGGTYVGRAPLRLGAGLAGTFGCGWPVFGAWPLSRCHLVTIQPGHRHVKWRLFLDADRKQMLFPTLSLAELYCARKERGLVAEQPSAVTLYLGQDDA